MIRRGEIWWTSLPDPAGSGPGYRRPVLVVSADAFNRTRITTVLAAAITSNLALAEAPGNVLLDTGDSGLPRDSVVNVSQVLTLDKSLLADPVTGLAKRKMAAVEAGLRLALDR